MKRFNLVIIGDELLNARRKDKHLENSIQALNSRGLTLDRSMIIGDEPELIVEMFKFLRKNENVVFSFGGIGATPDDYTRQCAATAFGLELDVHPEGKNILEEKFGDQTYPHRINMVTIPKGANLIPNPYNNIPGFSVEHFHFVPGFPQMAAPMVEWVLDNCYSGLSANVLRIRRTMAVYGKGEGAFVETMNQLLARFPDIKLSCLPRIDMDQPYVELSLLGVENDVIEAFSWLQDAISRLDVSWEQLDI